MIKNALEHNRKLSRPLALGLASVAVLVASACTVESQGPDDADDPETLDETSASGGGLTGAYYPSMTFAGTPVTRVDPSVNFDWGNGSPVSGIATDKFSVRWTGEILPLYSETYTFTTTSDDGIRVTVNGKKIIDNFTDHGPTDNTGTVALTAGQRVLIKIEFYENGGGAVAKLAWQSPRQAKQIVPSSQLFPQASTTPPTPTTPPTTVPPPPAVPGPLPLPTASTSPCWPYDRPTVASLRSSSKKVFAHYFSPYPISLDNQNASTDYYTRNYLNPDGEGGIHAKYGGLLRERPAPVTPSPAGVDYQVANMATEVRHAVAIGLDGFAYDLLSSSPSSAHLVRLDKLLAAIPTVDPGFRVQLIADMTATSFGGGGGSDATALSAILYILKTYANNPYVLHTADGRVVLSAFGAEKRNAAFWTNALAQAKAAGINVAFVPMTIGSWSSYSSQFAGVPMYGAASWGTRTVQGSPSLKTAPGFAHGQNLLWMGPIGPQDSRPKNSIFTESTNSAGYRAQWDATIAGGADWIQITTWNDYSEDSEIAPSSKTNNAFYDLAGYYTTWFKTGAQPKIARDVLYYFHRAHSMVASVAPPDLSKQTKAFTPANGPTSSVDMVEVVGLLTAPGTLQVTVGSQTQSKDVPAGIQSFSVPLVNGKPTFRLLRGGSKVVEFSSATTINNTITYQDPLYHAGSSLTCIP